MWLLFVLFVAVQTSAQSFETQVSEYLGRHLSVYKTWEYEILTKSVGTSTASLKIDNTKKFVLNGQYGYIPVITTDNFGKRTSLVITVRLRLYMETLVADEDIKKGVVLSPEYFVSELQEVSQLRSPAILGTGSLDNMQSRLFIKKGSILCSHMVEMKEVIKNGDLLTAYFNNGTVTVSMEVNARENGRLGEKIRIVSKDKKVYTGIVESASLVKIIE